MANAPSPATGLTTIAKKILMAVTGLALCVFLVLHLLGNTLLLLGSQNAGMAFNNYAHVLMTFPPLVAVMELGLLALFLLHAYEGVVVYKANKAARPQGYAMQQPARAKSERSRKSASSTTMIYTGIVILVFMLLHVGHFKFNKFWTIKEEYHTPKTGLALGASGGVPGEMHDLYRLVNEEFHNPIVVVIYVLCMIALGLHLNHAIFSATQTLGANNRRWEKGIRLFGRVFTLVIAGGFALLPIYMLLFGPAPVR